MADGSAIEWTEATWNPTTGCDKVSAGCDHCYALTLSKRLKAMGFRRSGIEWRVGWDMTARPATQPATVPATQPALGK